MSLIFSFKVNVFLVYHLVLYSTLAFRPQQNSFSSFFPVCQPHMKQQNKSRYFPYDCTGQGKFNIRCKVLGSINPTLFQINLEIHLAQIISTLLHVPALYHLNFCIVVCIMVCPLCKLQII
jgi:hypothetical protein